MVLAIYVEQVYREYVSGAKLDQAVVTWQSTLIDMNQNLPDSPSARSKS